LKMGSESVREIMGGTIYTEGVAKQGERKNWGGNNFVWRESVFTKKGGG